MILFDRDEVGFTRYGTVRFQLFDDSEQKVVLGFRLQQPRRGACRKRIDIRMSHDLK